MTHVERLVGEFDHHDPHLTRDPYPVYQRLREEGPVVRSDAWGGFWVVCNYELVNRVANDAATFSSAGGVTLPPAGNPRPLNPIEIDPPELIQYRRILNPPFSPGAMDRFEGAVRAKATELVDGFIDRGTCDFVTELAEPLSARSMLQIMGLEEADWAHYLWAVTTVVHESARDLNKAIGAFLEISPGLMNAIAARREPGDWDGDLIAHLVASTVNGTPLDDLTILDILFQLLGGGLHTTASAIAQSLLWLARHPDDRKRIAADPARLPAVSEELLRFQSPLHGLARTATKDVELGGQQIKAGDKLWLLWAAANRDPAEFTDPHSVDFDRPHNRHMSFGVGLHRCLGIHLARLEIRVALEEVLRRIPDYEIPEGAEAAVLEDCSLVYSLTSLPARF